MSWKSLVPEIIKFAPKLAKKLLGNGLSAARKGKKIASVLGVEAKPESVLEVLLDDKIDTDTPLKILENIENMQLDFDFLKSKKVFVVSFFGIALLILIGVAPENAQKNANIIQLLIGLVTVAVGSQGAIDHKNAGKGEK